MFLLLTSISILNYVIGQNTLPQAIQTSRDTTPCNVGYYWTKQSCMPCKSISNGDCSCQSYNECTTVVCYVGYQPNTQNNACQQIKACSSGCAQCSNGQGAQLCYTCSNGYTLIGNVCVPINLCSTYDLTTAICTACSDGSYLNWNYAPSKQILQTISTSYWENFQSQCSPCQNQCSKCSSGNTCAQCSPNYFWQVSANGGSGQCAACATSCSACTGILQANCTQCVQNYFLDPTTKNCVTCNITNCASCATNSTCGTCANGTTANSNLTQCIVNQVTLCSAGCSNCTNSTACTICASQYVLNNGSCIACTSGCQTCTVLVQNSTATPQSSCQGCFDTFTLAKSSDQTQPNTCNLCSTQGGPNSGWYRCSGQFDQSSKNPLQPTQCQEKYFLSVNGPNVTCIAYQQPNTCLMIENQNSSDCLTCLAGTQKLTQTYCQACSSVSNLCLACSVSNNATVCNQCAPSYFTTPASPNCTFCGTGCVSCSNATTCTTCNSNYYLNSNTNTCSQCSTNGCTNCPNNVCTACSGQQFLNTINSVVQCSICPSSCLTCSSSGQTCVTCPPNQIIQNGGCVTLQSAHCYATTTGSSCTTCLYGYYLQGGLCFQCVNPLVAQVCRSNQIANTSDSTTNGTTPGTSTKSFGQVLPVILGLLLIILQ